MIKAGDLIISSFFVMFAILNESEGTVVFSGFQKRKFFRFAEGKMPLLRFGMTGRHCENQGDYVRLEDEESGELEESNEEVPKTEE